MKENDIAEDFGEITLKEQRETGMNKKGDKLNHLKSCQVSEKIRVEIFLLLKKVLDTFSTRDISEQQAPWQT